MSFENFDDSDVRVIKRGLFFLHIIMMVVIGLVLLAASLGLINPNMEQLSVALLLAMIICIISYI